MEIKKSFITAIAVAAAFTAGAANADSFESTIPAKDFSVQLPQEIKDLGVFNVGVRCDYPPFGYVDAGGKNVGVEIDLAKALAYYAFGDATKVNFTCVTSANRIPNLLTSKVDMLLASMAYTTERSKTVEYAPQLYYAYYVEFLTNKDGPSSFKDLDGKTISTVMGAVYEPWFKKCMPNVKVLGYSTIDQAYEAFVQGRSDAIVHDNTILPGILVRNKNTKLSDDHIIPGYHGLAVRMGSGDLTNWLNEAVTAINDSDFYLKSLDRNESQPAARAALKDALAYKGHNMPLASPESNPSNSCDLIPSE